MASRPRAIRERSFRVRGEGWRGAGGGGGGTEAGAGVARGFRVAATSDILVAASVAARVCKALAGFASV